MVREHEEAVQPQLLVSNLGYLAPSNSLNSDCAFLQEAASSSRAAGWASRAA